MAINRDDWLKPFFIDHIPNWKCPSCNQGVLRLAQNSFRYAESRASFEATKLLRIDYRNYHGEEPAQDEIFIDYSSEFLYSVLLQCNNPVCREHVSSCGRGFVIEDYDTDLKEHDFVEAFVPEYFLPAINIFPLSKKYPDEIANEITSSFKLFFASPPASANYVRKAIDAILTNKGIRRYTSTKGKRKSINLHDRIIDFEKIKPEIAKKLFAIKWLGNEGSHTDTITKNDVLDAYEILEEAIDDLYIGRRKLIEKKVSKIIKRKRPLHPST